MQLMKPKYLLQLFEFIFLLLGVRVHHFLQSKDFKKLYTQHCEA